MDAQDLMDFGRMFASLGNSVQEQVGDVLESGPDAECNANAIRLAHERLSRLSRLMPCGDDGPLDEILDELSEWLKNDEAAA